ncbi:MAG: histidine kinase [Bacillota bacterium]|nr:histidine kinase [Bacillota bacterium]
MRAPGNPRPKAEAVTEPTPRLAMERIDAVVRDTVSAVQQGKEKIFQIGDLAREEHIRLTAEMEALKEESTRLAAHIVELERRARAARTRLAEISHDFQSHTEEDIRRAYQAAEQAQVELSVAHAQGTALVRRREELDRSIRQVEGMVTKAEELVNAVGLALEFLTGRVASQLAGLKQRTAVGSQIIEAQEEERRRIAREIHDGPAQAMANIVLRAEICEKTMETGKGDLQSELADLKRLAKDCLKEVRRIIFDLRPMALDDLGLVPTLARYVEELRKQVPFEIRFAAFGKERRLGQGVEAALFRFVQEALTNCRKYANASQAEVRVEFIPGMVRVVVEDDGEGFDPEQVLRRQGKKNEHFGLLGMKERVELFDGTFQVSSAPGKGTKVVAQIPLEGAVDESAAK